MRSVTKDNITDVFMGYLSKDTDPRMREIMGSLVKHLHDFARETNLTHDEWRAGIAFLEGCAAVETEDRHEFVLASDVLGLSSLVDMLHSSPDATSSSVLRSISRLWRPPAANRWRYEASLRRAGSARRRRHSRIPKGNPIAGAELDIWQTAPNGLYASQDEEQDTYSFPRPDDSRR